MIRAHGLPTVRLICQTKHCSSVSIMCGYHVPRASSRCTKMRRCWETVLHAPAPFGRRCATYAAPSVPIVSTITSTSNSYIKHCAKLRTSDKYRKQQSRVLLSSEHLIKEQLAKRIRPSIVALFVKKGSEVSSHIIEAAGTVVTVEEHVMKKLSGLDTVAGVTAVAEIDVHPQKVSEWDSIQRLLVLDRVQDPGNLGTLLRNAEALEWDAVFLIGCCDPYNDKAIRAARGSTFQVQHEIGSWNELRDRIQHHHITLVAAAMDAGGSSSESGSQHAPSLTLNGGYSDQLAQRKIALVLGSEGQGVSPEILQNSHRIAIPMADSMDSLNVAAAGSMIMFALSQRTLEGVLSQISSLLRV